MTKRLLSEMASELTELDGAYNVYSMLAGITKGQESEEYKMQAIKCQYQLEGFKSCVYKIVTEYHKELHRVQAASVYTHHGVQMEYDYTKYIIE